MSHRFQKHYTLEEARALLPQLRAWLAELNELRRQLKQADERIGQMMAGGVDAGGASVNEQIKLLAQFQQTIQKFRQREIQIKDLERGLIDFPSLLGGREVFLCWELEDDDIEFWHELDAGYAGRERL